MYRRNGFTLIELLVVIAIIALLAAILFPVFSLAREKARSATCQSNLKQLSLGFIQYNQDFDGYYPESMASPTNSNPPNYYFWPNLIQPYVKSTQIFTCPDSTLKTMVLPIYDTLNSCDTSSYGMNNQQFNQVKQVNMASIKQSATLILLMDSGEGFIASHGNSATIFDSNFDLDGDSSACTTEVQFNSARVARHTLGSNIAFCDGHVKWYPENFYYWGTYYVSNITAPSQYLQYWNTIYQS